MPNVMKEFAPTQNQIFSQNSHLGSENKIYAKRLRAKTIKSRNWSQISGLMHSKTAPPLGNNWYSYVGGDPINDSDPSGYAKLKAVYWLVKRVGSSLQKIRKVSKEVATRLFRKGKQDILVEESNKQANRIAKSGRRKPMKHSVHKLPDGSTGSFHYHTKNHPNNRGHSFFPGGSGAAGLGLGSTCLGNSLGLTGSFADMFNPLCDIETAYEIYTEWVEGEDDCQ